MTLDLTRRQLVEVVMLSTLCAVSLGAQEILKPLRTDTPPVIDGKLDDAPWQQTPAVTGFKTYAPDYGKYMSEATEVWAAYDSENLYFAFRCYDSEPDKIKSVVTSRDNNRSDDWICINLDSFSDQQSLYCFYVNALGIQSDSRFAAGTEDLNADFVWYSAGKIDEKGYTLEICLPLKSIRYTDGDPVTMGVVFERRISRRMEQGTYPALKPERGMAFQTQMMPMIYVDLKHYTLLEVLPSVTYSQKYRQDLGDLHVDERKADASLTLKYGITSDLILDGTCNPDFSQVEADAGQIDVNLRTDLFYPEKRPFFLEGAENFRIAATGISEIDPVISIVHTRTIVNPLAGLKLAGKIGAKNTVASVYAVDRIPDDQRRLYGDYAHFPIIRYKRALDEDSYIGTIYAGDERKQHYNRLEGLDGMWRMSESAMLEFHGLLSQSKDAFLSLQNSGNALGLRYFYNTRNVDYDFGITNISENFTDEMGFIARTGVTELTGLWRPKFYPPSEIVRRVDVEIFSGQTLDQPSDLWETYDYAQVRGYIFGSLSAQVRYMHATEVFVKQRFKTGALLAAAGGQFTKQLNLTLQYRHGDAIYYDPANPYQGNSNRAALSLVLQPSEQFAATASLVYADFSRSSDNLKVYDYLISRAKLTYQLNKYLFFRGIVEYNDYRKRLLTDFLASFTYIPGTVVHLGYGSLYEKIEWNSDRYVTSDRFLETQRGFFFKMSYLWRL